MSGPAADRNLLLGILAHQLDFVGRDALLEAMNAWLLRKETPLGVLLVERGELARSRLDLLEALVDEHIRAHGGDPSRSLRAISSIGPLAEDLGRFSDHDVRASVDRLRTASMTPPETRVPESLGQPTSWNGRFRVVRPHSSGGLGVVSVALDDELDREVALKEVKGAYADDVGSRARFEMEAEITGKLEHPGIVPIYGLGHDPTGCPFYAMRFIRGDSLADAIDRFHDPAGPFLDANRRSLQLRELLGRFLDVCDALSYAHSRGVLHRDLKPGNVMLGPFGETLLVDWGLALPLERVPEGNQSTFDAIKLTRSDSQSLPRERGRVVGTPAYMPPEQAEGAVEKLGPRSDVYGLGAIMYDLLTGRRPVEGSNLEEILDRVARGLIAPPRQVRAEVPAPLEAICLKALSLKPEDRYASPRALAADVKAWLADQPVSARREPFVERAARWRRKHRVAVGAATASTVVVALALAVGLANARARAIGLIETLMLAETGSVPAVIDQLDGNHTWVDGRLRAIFRSEPDDSAAKLRAGLGLIRSDREPLEYLYARMLDSTDAETVRVIRDSLGREHREELSRRLRRERPGMPEGRRFVASCALASFEPPGPVAPVDGAWIVAHLLDLSRRDPLGFRDWCSLLGPTLHQLVPDLISAYVDPRRDAPERRLCAGLLVDHARLPEDLVELIQVADERDFSSFMALLERDRAQVVPLLTRALVATSAADPDVQYRRGAAATVALGRLGSPEPTWDQLRYAADPATRWWLVDRLGPLRADPRGLIARLEVEADPSAFQALILSLGGFELADLPADVRASVAKFLTPRYRTDRHAGVHSSIDWLLRRWKLDAGVRAADRELVGPPVADRDWFVTPSLFTFSIVRGPVTFEMGPTPGEEGHDDRCHFEPHRRTIPRSFAISTREVTVNDMAEFLRECRDNDWKVVADGPNFIPNISPDGDCPMNAVNWHIAASFCRWLGDREKLGPAYPPIPEIVDAQTKTGRLESMHRGYLDADGYRLPTEAEWEFACRGGTTTPHPFGKGDGLLGRFAWTVDNARNRTWPACQLWPNDLGVFDMLGNIREVCQPPSHSKPKGAPPYSDGPIGEPLLNDGPIAMRGGCFTNPSHYCRSSCHDVGSLGERLSNAGFRLARAVK